MEQFCDVYGDVILMS